MARMLRLFSWCCIAPREKREASTTAEPFAERSDSLPSDKEKTQHCEESFSLPSPTSSFASTATGSTSSRRNLFSSFKYLKMNNEDEMAASVERIWERMLHKHDHTQRFFPESGWDKLLQDNEVEATLRKRGKDPVSPELLDFILKRARKIFAILLIMEKPELITTFHKIDYGQDNLPVDQDSVREKLEKDGWKSHIVSDFCEKQWWFMSPTFTSGRFRYDFVKFHHLPFTKAGGKANLGASHYSTVEERSIHANHVQFGTDQSTAKDESGNLRVAVKKLFNSSPERAEPEASVLEMMRELQSDHLIKAIAYYRYDERHHFMFPWAEHGNLWEFWTKERSPGLNKAYLIWAFKQINGLAEAIEKLHGQSHSSNCRHGDLKPENILCFRQENNDDSSTPAVRMVITDVGLAKDHKVRTQHRENTNTTVSTKRYAGPEMDVNPRGPLSRRFDIWSMGCIFLEFVIWILYGGMELIECTKALESTFYRPRMDGTGRIISAQVDPIVQAWISYIRKDWRCSKGTAIERLVQLITEKLLVVNLLESATSSPHRIYADKMREELKDILNKMETDSINAVGAKPPNNPPTPLGPSRSIPTTKDGLLAPRGPSTRNVGVARQYTS